MAGAAATEYRCSPVLNDTRRTRLSLRSCEHTLASKCGFQNTLLEAQGTCKPMDSDMPPPAMSFFPGTEASELGCISRSCKFGRALWCLARGMNTAIELFTGVGGGSTLLLAHALSGAFHRRQGHKRLSYFFTMERHLGNAYHAQNILESVGIPAQILSLARPEGLNARMAALVKETPGVWILHGDVFDNLGVFDALCSSTGIGSLDLVMLDPPLDLRGLWPLLDRACKPKFLAVHNANLPGHAGWLPAHLRRTTGSWYEMMNGSHPSVWERGERSWSLMGRCW
ncbi:unnamed protein product [Symbiodinium sp. CCMP2592]|nr:unnamed protein product [Symbiodinium sp. CCMP2592]